MSVVQVFAIQLWLVIFVVRLFLLQLPSVSDYQGTRSELEALRFW